MESAPDPKINGLAVLGNVGSGRACHSVRAVVGGSERVRWLVAASRQSAASLGS